MQTWDRLADMPEAGSVVESDHIALAGLRLWPSRTSATTSSSTARCPTARSPSGASRLAGPRWAVQPLATLPRTAPAAKLTLMPTPARSPAGSGSHAVHAGPTLEALFAALPAPPPVPAYERVPPAAVPEPYRGLLVHDRHMTVTMEAYHGRRVQVRVLQRGRSE